MCLALIVTANHEKRNKDELDQAYVWYLNNYTKRQRVRTFSVYAVGSIYRIFSGMPSFFDHGIPIIAMVILHFSLEQGIMFYNHPEF